MPATTATWTGKQHWIAAGVILVVTLVAYLPALDAGFIWDDEDYVTHNPVLRTLDGIFRIWFEPSSLPQYYPLVHTTFWIEYRLWQLDAYGYHLVNVLLHGLAAVLLYRVLVRLKFPAPLFVAAIFAVHPVHVETVAWVTERKNTLSAVFYLLALLAWMKWRPIGNDPEQKAGPPKYYWFALAAFCCALLSKTVTCSLPAVILLLIWWKEGRILWRHVKATLPMFAVGLALAMVTAKLEVEHVMARGAEWDFSFIERCLIAGRALWFYAVKLVLPVDLCFNYARWEISASSGWQYLFPAGALIIFAALWFLRKRIGRGPLAAVLIFSGSLFPALGFFNVYPMLYSFVADHFQYLASIALIALFGALGAWGIRRITQDKDIIQWVASILIAVILGLLTWQQSRIYEDLETLWLDTIEKNPASWLALGNLGGLWVDQGKLEEAREVLKESLRIKEKNPFAHNNLGLVLLQNNEMDEARKHLETSRSQRPDYAEVHNNLGVLFWRQDDFENAIKSFEKAVELAPRYPDANRNLAELYGLRGEMGKAIDHMSAALGQFPDHWEMRFLLGCYLIEEGRFEEALSHLQESLRLRPGFGPALLSAAKAWNGLNRPEKAKALLVAALKSDPGLEQAVDELAALLAQYDAKPQSAKEIIKEAEKACRSIPDQLPRILNAMAREFKKQNRTAAADEAEQRARELTERR